MDYENYRHYENVNHEIGFREVIGPGLILFGSISYVLVAALITFSSQFIA